jgi:hypothetical protein
VSLFLQPGEDLMAKLQMFNRLGTPLQPLHSAFLSPCSLRVSPSSCTVSSTTKDQLSISAYSGAAKPSTGGATSNNESCRQCKYKESCTTGGWAKYSGSRTERGTCRAAGLLEAEAPVLEESTRPSESTQLSSSQSTFEAKAGLVECGSRGCRPIFDEIKEEDYHSLRDEDWGDDEALRQLAARAASYTERRTVRDLEMCPDISFPLDFAEFVNDVWHEKSTATKYFHIAMKRNPNDANMLLRYAQFTWRTLGDLDKADELFARAVEESQNDTDVHAAYALFLWQTEE